MNKSLNKTLRTALNILKKCRIIYIILSILSLVLSVSSYFLIKDRVEISLVSFIIVLVLRGISLYYVPTIMKKGELFLEAILSNKIFADQVYQSLNNLYSFMFSYYIITVVLTFSLQLPLLALTFVIYIVREIFHYGNQLEKEMSEVI